MNDINDDLVIVIEKAKKTGILNLDFTKYNFQDIPNNILKLVDLTSLTIINFSESFISESLGNLVNLEELTFIDCMLVKIPDSIGNLKELKKFTFIMSQKIWGQGVPRRRNN